MIVVEFILRFLGKVLAETIFDGVIRLIFKGISRLLDFIRYNVLGLKRGKAVANPVKALQKKLLYKRIELTEIIASGLCLGQQGSVLEIIDKDSVFAEFYHSDGTQVEVDGEFVFKVKISQFELKS